MTDSILFGSAFAIRRYETYKSQVLWYPWGLYKGYTIEHAHKISGNDLKQMCLYRASFSDKISEGYIVGENLAQIKEYINLFRKEGRK